MEIKYKTRKGQFISVRYDDERWVTSKDHHHFLINEQGDILKGFSGLFQSIKDIGGNAITKAKLSNIESWEDARDYAKEYGIKVNPNTIGAKPKDIAEIALSLYKVLDTFPCVKDYVKEIGTYDKEGAVWGMRPDGTFLLGEGMFNQDRGLDELRRIYNISSSGWDDDDEPARQNEKTKFKTKNRTVEGGIAHEIGHAMVNTIFLNDLQDKYKNYPNLNRWEIMDIKRYQSQGGMAKDILLEALHRVKRTDYGRERTNNELFAMVSGYASSNPPSETVAECVADWYDNREKANPLSKTVVRVLGERLGKNAIRGL